MSGISDKALAFGKINHYKFNGGNELEENNFSDGSGLQWYDATYRSYDPQIGRFGQIDPLGDMSHGFSPYSFGSNNPALLIDPLGLMSDSAHPVQLQEIIIKGVAKAKSAWNQFASWFSGSDVGYTGSGWGHGPRRWAANRLGIGNNASSFAEMLLQSQLQADRIHLTGNLLNKLQADPAMIAFQNQIIALLKADPRFGKLAFVKNGRDLVEFGGARAPGDMMEQLKHPFDPKNAATWNVADNELTWAVRHAGVSYSASVKEDGTMVISYQLNDEFNIRPEGHTDAYKNVVNVLGPVYHDAVGGNDQLKVDASWQTIIK